MVVSATSGLSGEVVLVSFVLYSERCSKRRLLLPCSLTCSDTWTVHREVTVDVESDRRRCVRRSPADALALASPLADGWPFAESDLFSVPIDSARLRSVSVLHFNNPWTSPACTASSQSHRRGRSIRDEVFLLIERSVLLRHITGDRALACVFILSSCHRVHGVVAAKHRPLPL